MSTFIKEQVVVAGLTVLLSAPVFGQSDSGAVWGFGKRFHVNDVSVINNDGKHKTYSIRATDTRGKICRMRKIDDKIVLLEVDGKAVPRDQYARYDELLGNLGEPPVPPVPPAAPLAPAAPAVAAPVTPAAPAAPAVSPTVAAPPVSPLPPTPPAPPEPPRANKYVSHIIDDLFEKGLITEENKLSFLLDNEQLIVNGVKQPDNVFQFFKQKYIKHAGDHFSYERHGSSVITTIKTDDDNH